MIFRFEETRDRRLKTIYTDTCSNEGTKYKEMTVSIITIGDEILIGQIIDTNSAWMAEHLNEIGASIDNIYSVSDTKEGIVDALSSAMDKTDVLLLTGGLGPTKDDITKKTIADFLDSKMVFHEETWERIQELFKRFGRNPVPAHREQCFMPEAATLLLNKRGTAPGMWFEKEGKVIVSMPGVPHEMKYLMEFEVLPKLLQTFSGTPIAHRTILTVGEGESRIAARIEPIANTLPSHFKLAFLPGFGKVRLRLTAIGKTNELLANELEEQVHAIQQLIPELIYGYEKESLESAVGKLLKERNMTIGTAESCTGGLLGHQISSVSGASAYYEGSVVAYSYRLKETLLGVHPTTLVEQGAVSEQTVLEMAKGAIDTLGTNIAVSISGIAGPTGGTPDKPVGTIWLAISDKKNTKTLKLQLGKDRQRNVEYTCVAGLNLIRQFLLKYYPVQKVNDGLRDQQRAV